MFSARNVASRTDQRMAMGTAAFIVWGATAYHYLNTGFSVAIIIFLLYFIYSYFKKTYPGNISINKLLTSGMMVLYGSLFFSTMFHLNDISNLYGGYFSAVGFAMYTLPMWMIIYVGWNHDIRNTITYTLFGVLYAMCLYGIYHYFEAHQVRLSSFYHFPTRIGMMLDMFIPMTGALGIYYRKKFRMACLAGILVGLEFICLALAKVRGSYIAFMVAFIVSFTVFVMVKKKEMIQKHVVWLVLLAATLTMLFGGLLVYAGSSRSNYAIHGNSLIEQKVLDGGERTLMWKASYKMWIDNPITGIGLNQWQSTYASNEYRPKEATEIGQIMPHNVFIYFFTTGGIIGGIGYILYCISVAVWMIRQVREDCNCINIALLFIFVAATTHGIVDQTFILKLTGRIYYMLLGAGIVFQRWVNMDKINETHCLQN